jgi:hypothetical protein
MKHICYLLLLSLAIIGCKNGSDTNITTKNSDTIVLKDLRAIADDDSTITELVLSDDCPDRWDSTFEAHTEILKDSIIELYDQLSAHINHLAKKGKLKESPEPFIEAFTKSKEAFLQALDADPAMYMYSYGNATGAGSYGGCYYYTLLQNRLAFMKELVGKYYWDYDFETHFPSTQQTPAK